MGLAKVRMSALYMRSSNLCVLVSCNCKSRWSHSKSAQGKLLFAFFEPKIKKCNDSVNTGTIAEKCHIVILMKILTISVWQKVVSFFQQWKGMM